MNAFLSMRHYGLVTDAREFALSDIGKELLQTSTDGELIAMFATHILLHFNGIQLVEVVHSAQSRGDTLTVRRVANELLALGIDPGGTSGENINPMRLWLERAGVFKSTWTIDSDTVKRLTGATTDEISELAALPLRQQAILRALATVTEPGPHLGSKCDDGS